MIRIWFNHWFSTSYRLIELMKADKEEEIYIIGTNTRKNSVIQKVCDEWYEEPEISGMEYIEYCLKFCKEHKVDVLVPRRNMVEISKNIELFEKQGVKVMVDAFEKIEILNDKAKAYELFADCPEILLPEYEVVTDVDQFEKAFLKLEEKYGDVCVKFVKDAGGMSFRRVIKSVDRFQELRVYPGCRVSYDDLYNILKEQGTFDELMVMPYLPEDEISVDCLNTKKGLIAVTRVKGPYRDEQVIYDEKLIDMCHIILQKVPLEYPCNIQFKIRDDKMYLLEVNTRMSGGLQMSCLAADINIPNIALNKLLGKEIEWTMDRREKIVSYIELPHVIGEM